MKKLSVNKRTITLVVILMPLLATFIYVAVRSGPLAPVSVTVAQVESDTLSPALFGIGAVEARYTYRIGSTMTGHVLRLDVHVGDKVKAGQVVGEMDPVDMDNKIASMNAAIKRTKASVIAAEARVVDSAAREHYARDQLSRYKELVKAGTVSQETADAKDQEYQIASASLAVSNANLNAIREELAMLHADQAGLAEQRKNLRLISPVDTLVVKRYVEPGSIVVTGQPIIELIDPASIWINVRFDQLQSRGLAVNQPAKIVLRSQSGNALSGSVSRIEPMADMVTEEILAKVTFEELPDPLPPIGELAEVTVGLTPLANTVVVPNASIKRYDGIIGVWLIDDGTLRYAEVKTGEKDLNGRVQILSGLEAGDKIVVYSKQALTRHSRVSVVDQLVDEPK